jgi:glutamate dehydrogenase (NAD(P)+)
MRAGWSVTDASVGVRSGPDAILDVDCEIWAPAARPDVVTRANVDRLRIRLVLEGANIQLTDEAERALHHRGVTVLPDFIAIAGGIICAAMKYRGSTEREGFNTIAEKIRSNVEEVLAIPRRESIAPREAALRLAVGRVTRAMQPRRWSLL